MNQRLTHLLLGALVLVAGSPPEATAARGRRRDRARAPMGGSVERGRSGGEALAQSFYEMAVEKGKTGQYGQARSLMARAVEKSPSNEKYRYYLSLLHFKIGDLGDASREAEKLRSATRERYQTKAMALLDRIDGILKGDIPTGGLPGEGGTGAGMHMPSRVLPPDAYVNIARTAGGKPDRVEVS